MLCELFPKIYLDYMAGARRQIFIAFAVFLLVKKFHFTVQEVTILFVINNMINYFISPLIGRSIIRFGERAVLSCEYFSLIFIFLAYAFLQSKWIVAMLYILDHIFFNFAIAIRTYFQKVGTQGISLRVWPWDSPSITLPPWSFLLSGDCCGSSITVFHLSSAHF